MKKLIALLLVAVMCLSFVACGGSGNIETPPSGENTNNQGGDNNGNNLEKIERGTVTTSENPLLQVLFQTLADEGWSYTFNEDGTCADQVYWWIESDTENSMTIMIASEYKWKYQIGIMVQGENAIIQPWSAMYNGDSFVDWMPPYPIYEVPYVAKIERGTVTTSKNPLLPILLESIANKYSYTFKEDGTCSDTDYWWIESDTEKSMAIKISTEYKWKYLFEIEIVGPFARVMPMSAIYNSDVFMMFATMDKEYMIPYNIGGTHNLLSELCGEWIDSTDYCDPWSYFTIRNDGTCTVDGEEAFWMISDRYTTEDNLYIEIYNGSTHLGGIMIWGNDKVVQGVGTNFGFTQGYYEKVTN